MIVVGAVGRNFPFFCPTGEVLDVMMDPTNWFLPLVMGTYY